MSTEMSDELAVATDSDAGSSPLRLRQSRKRPKLEYTSSSSNSSPLSVVLGTTATGDVYAAGKSTPTLDVSVIDVAESTGTDPAESEELDEWPETHFADAQVNIWAFGLNAPQ